MVTETTSAATPLQADDVGAFFAKSWALYRTMLTGNILSHREFFDVLKRELAERMPAGGRLLDLACGDATMMAPAIPSGADYTGVDLARPALDLAAECLRQHGISATLVEADFQVFMAEAPASPGYDAVVISYSLHHLETAAKQKLLNDIIRVLRPGGALWVIDGMRQWGDNRPAWLDRLWHVIQTRGANLYSPEELAAMKSHVWTSDFPESSAGYAAMAIRAGYERWEFLLGEGEGSLGMFRATKPGAPVSGVGGVKEDQSVGAEDDEG